MGTISDKLMRVINTKEDIRKALISKGYDVPASIPFKEYAKMILDLPCKIDDFPELPGDVTRWHFGGLTNEMMAAMDDPRIEDADHKGRFLSFKNFAWKGMSGVGGYVGDFSKWVNNRDTTEIGITKSNSKVIIDVKVSQGSGKNIVFISKSNLGISNNVTIKITSTYPEGVMKFANSASNKYLKLPSNGIITLQDNPEYTSNEMHLHLASADLGQITIEQLPLYPGALVFDGVDDYGVCENFPILTKEKGYTVVALRQWLSFQDIGYPTLVVNSTDRLAAFSFEDFRSKTKSTWNWERSVGLSDYKIPLLYTYQTSTSYNSKTIYAGATEEGSNILQVCRSGIYCANAAIWEIVILDHDATEEELTKIKDYFVKTYPWLFPDQAWTVVGKTNEDEDRATIANITGNGNNLVLSNFGFAEGSGYGLYAQNYISYAITNRAVYTKINSSIHVTKSITAGVNFTESARDVTIPSYRIKVTGIQSGQEMIYRGSNNTFLTNIPSDGIYVLPAVENGSNLGFQFVSYTGDCDITIEQIPEYEGYLVTDGVDDRVQDSSFKLNKDWTLVGEWVFLNQKATNAGITKPFSFVVYNRTTGLSLFINTGTSGITIENVKSIKAICSDGRIYFDDWSKMLISKDQDITSSTSVLSIGFNGTAYTQMAFKNLGIYNNQLLSKDDCIKAYNYLQTLKSK